ncbi:MAG: PEGA domain-containing protein [candidate division Zixibacteria bacterium]|nr:PEGA domain-containing protein [candidate division Zixibacteria bacterium]
MANRLINQRFELLRRLSSDASGTQYYTWDRANPRSLLVIEIPASAEPEQHRQTLAGWTTLHHPNVHRLYHALSGPDNAIYLVCEYVDALNLETVLTRLGEIRQRLSPPVALAMARYVLLGLADAHSTVLNDAPGQPTLTHGALDGHTIWLTSTGQIKITAFGLHSAVSADANAPSTGPSPSEFDDLAAVGRLLVRMLSHASATGDDLNDIPEPYRDITDRMLQSSRSPWLGNAAALATEIGRFPECPTDDQATDRIARLFEAIQSDDEAEERRRVHYLRGGGAAQYKEISATEIPPAAVSRKPLDQIVESEVDTKSKPRRNQTKAKTGQRKRTLWPAFVVLALVIAVAILWRTDSLSPVVSTVFSPFREALKPSGPELVTTPSGAEVIIGGEVAGETPYVLTDLSPGPMSIRLTYPGFRPIDTVLIVKDPKDVGPFTPFIFQKRIRFSSIPGGATVFVDGRELSAREAADFWVSATDTVLVEFELRDQEPLAPAYVSPMTGLAEPTDTTIWTWIPERERHGGELLGQFERLIRVRSIPSGAAVYVNRDTIPIGETEMAFPAAYGRHRIRLEKRPFLDYAFDITVGRDSPSLYSVALQRTVHICVADAQSPMNELAARIDWIRQGDQYLKTPVDQLTTPYSLLLDGHNHELHLSREGYADTTVTVAPMRQSVEVLMRPQREDADLAQSHEGDEDANRRGWVRFVVQGDEGPVPGAEVIGVEKSTGLTLRYGLTDAAGEFVTYVPVGDYDWHAAKPGFEGQNNGERVKAGRGIKTITLRLNDRGR